MIREIGLILLIVNVNCFVYDIVDYHSQDLLSTVNASGKNVVKAAIAKVEETIFYLPFDYSLTLRVALMESNFGTDLAVMENNDLGGIWQITENIYEDLRDNVNDESSAKILLDDIKLKFGFECFLCNYSFNTPLKSALAFRLYLEHKAGNKAPLSLVEQAKWWAENYHSNGNEEEFKQKVNEDEKDYHMHDKTDIWIVCDSSDSVSEDEFESSINFTCSMASQCTIGKTKTQCGMSTYYHEHEVKYEFDDTTNYEDFQTVALSTEKQDSNRYCGSALTMVYQGFNETEMFRAEAKTAAVTTTQEVTTTVGTTAVASTVANNSLQQLSDNILNTESNVKPRQKNIVLITDRQSKDDINEPIKKLKENNITIFNLAVGEKLNKTKIRQTTKEFGSHFTYFLSNFMDLTDKKKQKDIFEKYCSAIIYSPFYKLHYDKKKVQNLSRSIDTKEQDVDFICVVICITFVDASLDDEPEKNRTAVQKEMEKIFHIDCNLCKNYSSAQINAITEAFQANVLSLNPSKAVELIKQVQNKDETTTTVAQTTQASVTTEATTPESLCGDDFKSDVWFLLDGSASIDEKEFDAVQNFTATMASKFDVSSKNVQLGLSVFAHNYKVVYDLKEETDLNAFESATNMASQPPFFKNVGKAVKDALKNAFDASNGARTDDASVKRNLVVLVEGNATDDVSQVKQLAQENNVTIFAIGIGKNINRSIITSLASEPVNKHALVLPDFTNLDSFVSKNILNTIEKTPLNLKKKRSLRISGRPGASRDVITSISKDKDLIMTVKTIEASAKIQVYIKVGNDTASSALYDAMFELENGGGDVTLSALKLLDKYPSFIGDEVKLSINIVVDKVTEINVSFKDDERTDSEKATDMLEQLLEQCDNPKNYEFCIENLNASIAKGKLLKVSMSLIDNAETLLVNISKEYVIQNLEYLIQVCQNETDNKTVCIDGLAANIKRGVSLEMTEIDLKEGRDLLQKLLTQEINEITTECGSAGDPSACYAKLKARLDLADDMNISNAVVEESKAALAEFQTSEQGSAGFQTNPNTIIIATIAAVAAAAAIAAAILFMLYKKKKKKQVQPMSELEEMHQNIKTLTAQASQPSATYSCFAELKKLHSIAEQWQFNHEDLHYSREILQQLEQRLEKTKDDLEAAIEEAHKSDASIETLHQLQEQIAVAKSLEFPNEILSETEEALAMLNHRLYPEVKASGHEQNEETLSNVKMDTTALEPDANAISQHRESDTTSVHLSNKEKMSVVGSIKSTHSRVNPNEDNEIDRAENLQRESDNTSVHLSNKEKTSIVGSIKSAHSHVNPNEDNEIDRAENLEGDSEAAGEIPGEVLKSPVPDANTDSHDE